VADRGTTPAELGLGTQSTRSYSNSSRAFIQSYLPFKMLSKR